MDIDLFKQSLNLPIIEANMKTLAQVECPTIHHFSEGLYTRETLMPKGSLILGRKHKQSTINVLLQGRISVYMGEDEPVKHLQAPCVFTSEAGVQKLAYIHEDVIWLNSHPTNETDIDKIEQEVIV